MDNLEINLGSPQSSGGVVEIRGGGRGPGVTAIVVGLVVVIGLVVAVGRSRDKSVAEPSTTTSAVSTTTIIAPTTTTSRTTTTIRRATTTVPAVRVYGQLLPDKTGTTLVMVQQDGHLVQVEVDTGTVTDLLPGQRIGNVYQLVALGGGAVVTGQRGTSLIANGAVSALSGVDQLMGSPDGVHLVGLSYTDAATRVVSLTPGGAADAAPLPIPTQSDPVALLPGALVLQSRAGGVYRFDLASGEVRKIADGAFLAAAGDRVASITCDDGMKCRIGIGHLGGRPIHQTAVVADTVSIGYYGPQANALSPTRDLMAYLTTIAGRPTVVVLDLDTGETALSAPMNGGPENGSPFVWSADGRWLFWADLGQVKAWSPDRGGDPIDFANPDAGSAQVIAAGFSG